MKSTLNTNKMWKTIKKLKGRLVFASSIQFPWSVSMDITYTLPYIHWVLAWKKYNLVYLHLRYIDNYWYEKVIWTAKQCLEHVFCIGINLSREEDLQHAGSSSISITDTVTNLAIFIAEFHNYGKTFQKDNRWPHIIWSHCRRTT